MRLTLRTLLAYLDDTLEPQDAQILRQKLEQSGFATQLVQRIRSSLAEQTLSAPAPDSVHPIEEPNMMSDYLDSTLSPEQIAEIENACLKSLPHLAEAAACHQILTLVLGRPADASDSLRDRIYQMVSPGGKVQSSQLDPDAIEIGAGFSSLAIPGPREPSAPSRLDGGADKASLAAGDLPAGVTLESGPSEDSLVDELSGPSVDQVATGTMQQPTPSDVRPVGVADSGVRQAAAKLKEQSLQAGGVGTPLDNERPLAGSRPLRQLERSDYFQGPVRTSRIAPWLVSLTLVGALLFAISRIFLPLLNPDRTASVDQDKLSETYPAVDSNPENDAIDEQAELNHAIPLDRAPESEDIPMGVATEDMDLTETNPSEEIKTPADTTMSDVATGEGLLPEPVKELDENASADVRRDGGNDLAASDLPASDLPASDLPASDSKDLLPQPETVVPMDRSDVNSDSKGDLEPKENNGQPNEVVAAVPDPTMGVTPDLETNDPGVVPEEPGPVLATLQSENALIAAVTADNSLSLLAKDAKIVANTKLVCGPEYRAALALDGNPETLLTLVGPTAIGLLPVDTAPAADTGDIPKIKIQFGRGVTRFANPGTQLIIQVNDQEWTALSTSADASLAIQLNHDRQLGADPMVAENRTRTLKMFSVTGDFSISGPGIDDSVIENKSENGLAALKPNDGISIDLSKVDPVVTDLLVDADLKAWVDPETDTGSLEADAAEDLLELVRSGNSDLLLSLRVALNFRRNEVVSLAGHTMLALDDASAYFGVDGLLSNAKQRLYWSSHMDALRDMMARGVEESTKVRTAIAGQNDAIDDTDGDTLFRLLTGYSADDLAAGGDGELVADLESASMPVRVLASEHLRDINGTTLFFKPDEEVDSRREDVIKKWKVRLRKGVIRYPETE